jgi:hypothetical protein
MFLIGASRHLHNECSREREEFMYGNLHLKVSILHTLVFRRKSAFEFKYSYSFISEAKLSSDACTRKCSHGLCTVPGLYCTNDAPVVAVPDKYVVLGYIDELPTWLKRLEYGSLAEDLKGAWRGMSVHFSP